MNSHLLDTFKLVSCPHSGLFLSVFSRIRTEYGISLRIQSECGKIRTRITPNTDTFHAMQDFPYIFNICTECTQSYKKEELSKRITFYFLRNKLLLKFKYIEHLDLQKTKTICKFILKV